jgi:hypothetical protein
MPLTRPDTRYLYANVRYDETSNLREKVSWKRKSKTMNPKEVLPATSPRGVVHEVRTLEVVMDGGTSKTKGNNKKRTRDLSETITNTVLS